MRSALRLLAGVAALAALWVLGTSVLYMYGELAEQGLLVGRLLALQGAAVVVLILGAWGFLR